MEECLELSRIAEILTEWGICFKKIRGDLPLAGSPERSLHRFVVEDLNGLLHVFEHIYPEQTSRREEIGKTLDHLIRRGIENIQRYTPALHNGFVVYDHGDAYQLSPYVMGIELIRPGYIFEEWRGTALGSFLVDLKDKASHGVCSQKGDKFSIVAFMDDLAQKMKQRHPDLLAQIEDIIKFLHGGFGDVDDRAPSILCHGDFHPLNVIWSKKQIAAVIDWEFMGMKPEFYDVAIMIGCVGMENPNGLVGGLASHFIATLDNANFLSPPSRNHLPEAVIALRFAWLSDWLRRNDNAMIEMEIDYLRMLMNNIEDLRYSWGCKKK
jgi:homoserine kinase type II